MAPMACYTITLLLGCFVVIINCQTEQGRNLSDEGKCNEININFGQDSKQPGTGSGPRGPRGLKGEKGDAGFSQEASTAKVVSAMFKALAATSCKELMESHGMTEAGYYLMRSGEKVEYKYCDFESRAGISTCHQMRERLGEKMVSGYYLLNDWEGKNPDTFYCNKYFTDSPTRCTNVDWREAKVLHENGGVFNIFQYFGMDEQMDVYCDSVTDGGGWLVFQRRMDGSVEFYRDWADYVGGFGDLDGEFWLGLETIHQLTNDSNFDLRIDLTDWSGNTAYAQYEQFRIGSEDEEYAITFGSYSGTAGDSLSDNYAQPFSTRNVDNDNSDRMNCAIQRRGAWWYDSCGFTNLNGLYKKGGGEGQTGIWWWAMTNGWKQLKLTEMKIRQSWSSKTNIQWRKSNDV